MHPRPLPPHSDPSLLHMEAGAHSNPGTLIQFCSLYPFRSWHAHSDLQPIPIQMQEAGAFIDILYTVDPLKNAD